MRDNVASCDRVLTPIGKVRTDPNARDTDSDRIPDGIEVKGFFINQVVVVSKANKKKRTYKIGKVHTNPLRRDTDKDGLSDRAERTGVRNKKFGKDRTDPRNCDTALGGNSDGKEIRKGSNPADRPSSPKNPRGKTR